MIEHPDQRLRRHLTHWLGRWPADAAVDVVGAPQRTRPGWDGTVRSFLGVRALTSAVLSVAPEQAPAVRRFLAQSAGNDLDLILDSVTSALPTLLHQPDRRVYSGVFRWCERPADLPEVGQWVDADEKVPEWLRPFGHQVLVVHDPDTGEYLAGVGIKYHDEYGRELAVGTEPAARGRGLARHLVAQAARRILDEGGIPTYQHDPANLASARVADAAGFPDRGWRSMGLF